jgi:hypothetical protein
MAEIVPVAQAEGTEETVLAVQAEAMAEIVPVVKDPVALMVFGPVARDRLGRASLSSHAPLVAPAGEIHPGIRRIKLVSQENNI